MNGGKRLPILLSKFCNYVIHEAYNLKFNDFINFTAFFEPQDGTNAMHGADAGSN